MYIAPSIVPITPEDLDMKDVAIYAKVAATVAETLNVDRRKIKPASKLQADLGAESIDILDIMFRLENEFDIQLRDDDIFPDHICRNHPGSIEGGVVTEVGLAHLRTQLPFADVGAFAQNPQKTALGDLFTVEMIARHLQKKLAEAVR
jgi:acyl carrier protein